MPSISTLIVRVFDEPRPRRRRVRQTEEESRTRFEAKGLRSRRQRG
ncbi:MAG: hypothetical protein JWR11_4051 [Mycobacterium sp.]|jgi:hypothetical protein|nr:hypothetical protein [Mycobacterium sp.]MDT5178870.1 hypothetical protein [Mycobacterium sp.]